MEIPATRHAWVYKKGGLPRTVLQYEEIPLSQKIAPDDVIIKVKTVSINPVDYKFMTTGFLSWIPAKPCVVAMDVAGIIVGVGSKVKYFKIGDQVLGKQSAYSMLRGGRGTLSTFVHIHSDMVTLKPDSMSWDEAAGLPLTGMTAYVAFFNTAKIRPSQRLLIVGASGGVGTVAVQIAKAKGCHVVAVCSGKNSEFVKRLGADEVLDYTVKPIEQQLVERHTSDPFDLILDCIDVPAVISQSYKYLKPNGQSITVGDSTSTIYDISTTLLKRGYWLISGAFFGGRKYRNIVLLESQSDLVGLMDIVKRANIKIPIDSTYEMDQAVEAFERLMSHRAKGKIIIRVE